MARVQLGTRNFKVASVGGGTGWVEDQGGSDGIVPIPRNRPFGKD